MQSEKNGKENKKQKAVKKRTFKIDPKKSTGLKQVKSKAKSSEKSSSGC